MIKAKTFIEALNCFSTNPRRSKRFLTDKRLSQHEKVILNCFFLLRENQHQQIITELAAISEITDAVVNAQKNLLLGITYNNLNQYPKAILSIQAALLELKHKNLEYFEMIGNLNLFIIYQNLKDEKSMRNVLSHLKKLKIHDPLSKIRILRCHFKYYIFTNNLSEAQSALEEIMCLKEFMSDSDATGLLVDQFNFAITKSDLNQAKMVVQEMKSYRAFACTDQYNYMKKLLDHLTADKPIYIQNQNFLHSPVLHHQIQVIQFLAEANLGEATEAWNKLRNMNCNLYQENLTYTGPTCLFSLCLLKHQTKNKAPETLADPISFLQNYQGPIRKEVLFKSFWGRELESKEDYKKLSKHLYDLKQKYGFELKTQKGCYLLVQNKKDKKAA